MKLLILPLAAILWHDEVASFTASPNSARSQWHPALKVSSTSSNTYGSSSDAEQQGDSNPNIAPLGNERRTLYDVLDAKITDSRAELKRKYVTMAKQSHPDAAPNGSTLDFSEVAAAWEVLSDTKQRKRYDRSLQAEQLSEDIASFVSKQAQPVTELSVKALENVALPFLRRTTATTLASVQAAVKNKDLSNVLSSAFQAAAKAGRAVDRMEYQEKSAAMEARAVSEYKQAVDLQHQLSITAAERLKMTLFTAGSGITSAEATLLLETFNRTLTQQVATPSVWERANFLRHSVQQEIATLQQRETTFMEVQKFDSSTQEAFRSAVRGRLLARTSLTEAELAEAEASRVYEECKRKTAELKTVLESVVQELSYTEVAAQKSSYELERQSLAVEQQSENVRLALRQKEQALQDHAAVTEITLEPVRAPEPLAALANKAGLSMEQRNQKPKPYEFVPESKSRQENEERLQKLSVLRQQERELIGQAQQIELKAAKLLSRADKLKSRAKALGRQQ